MGVPAAIVRAWLGMSRPDPGAFRSARMFDADLGGQPDQASY